MMGANLAVPWLRTLISGVALCLMVAVAAIQEWLWPGRGQPAHAWFALAAALAGANLVREWQRVRPVHLAVALGFVLVLALVSGMGILYVVLALYSWPRFSGFEIFQLAGGGAAWAVATYGYVKAASLLQEACKVIERGGPSGSQL